MKIKTIEAFAVAFLLSVSLNTAQAEKAATDKAPAKKAAGKQTDRRADRPSRESIIKRFDKDGDGKLNDEERKAAMAARPKPGEGGKPEGKGKKEDGEKKKKGKKEKK